MQIPVKVAQFSLTVNTPGEHAIKITVKDVDGRESSTVINLNVAK